MPTYKFVGDSPRSLPAFGIDVVFPGETVETDRELNNPYFQLKEKKTEKAQADKAPEKDTSPEPVKEKK